MSILASETASAADGGDPGEGHPPSQSRCGRGATPAAARGLLLRWLRRWMKIRHNPGTFSRARSHAHAVVLLAAAETERAGASDLPDASLRDGAADAATALLSHAGCATDPHGGRSPSRRPGRDRRGGCRQRGRGRRGRDRPVIPWVACSRRRGRSGLNAPSSRRPTPAPLPGFGPGDRRGLLVQHRLDRGRHRVRAARGRCRRRRVRIGRGGRAARSSRSRRG